MSYISLYIENNPIRFAGTTVPFKDANYTVIGVPFDSTSSYKPGSRFAPTRIREASLNIESNSLTGVEMFIEDMKIADLGDLGVVHGNPEETLRRIEAVIAEIVASNKIPVVIGGEHTITAGVIKGFVRKGIRPCLLVFDAHLDLRDEYLGCKLGHASAIRRALEATGLVPIVYVGTRAFDREELEHINSLNNKIKILKPADIKRLGPLNTSTIIKTHLKPCHHIYLSVDIDGIDPSYAPGTGTPEPLGLSTYEVFRILAETVDKRFVGMDLVEVNPLVDVGDITSILAARIIQEFILLRG